MSVVFDRAYQFVPPHRGNRWPSFIQRFRITDRYLARREGVVDYELRGMQHWRASLDRGDGILLAPNHCRYADPLVMGWPARHLQTHVYAVASWHLFNQGWLESFGIQKMGAFSLNREGSDRQSLELAISFLASAERPLILFPEGTTNRTNDVLKPLLDGVAFIARTAARRRAKVNQGQVVMHPVAMKYLCVGETKDWANEQLTELESRFDWRARSGESILGRTLALAEAMLSLKEIHYLGRSMSGPLPGRRDTLIEDLLLEAEDQLDLEKTGDTRDRVRTIRTEVVTRHFRKPGSAHDTALLKRYATMADLAQELLSYPNCYLEGDQVTDTRIVETIQRMQESLLGKANVRIPLKVVIECDEAIVVPPEKSVRGEEDPLMTQLRQRLDSMLHQLSQEATPATKAGLA